MGPISIAMISDFFHPAVGGVENHIYVLSVELLRRGHKVIVITHAHPPNQVGIRWLTPGIKVYYIPFKPIASSATLPEFFTFLPYLRTIALREHINLIHAHASLSALGHEGILHAHLMGIRTVFTDHSLFGFEDAASILTNKLLAATMRHVDAVICVSHTARENTVLRACISPEIAHVIPNAIVAERFKPLTSNPHREDDTITIVVISRLAYRKGVDLLVATAPRVCKLFPRVRFIIGGDGPKLVELLQMREKHRLEDRIDLLGHVKPDDVPSVLNQGVIFLNTSLTESFGIAIVEAACSGLYVVSTEVGGVPEVLPSEFISFAKPEEDDVIRALSRAIQIVSQGSHDPMRAHENIKDFYNWKSVADRTEVVYKGVMEMPQRDLWTRIQRTWSLGPFVGPIYLIMLVVQCSLFWILEWTIPREDLDYVHRSWSQEQFSRFAEHYSMSEAQSVE